MKLRRFFGSCVVTTLGCAPAFAAPVYHVADLGALPGAESFATGINSAGTVVGFTVAPDGTARGTVWPAGGPPTFVDPPEGLPSSMLQSINTAGQVLGYSFAPDLHVPSNPLLWSAASGATLIGDSRLTLNTINEQGVAAGNFHSAGDVYAHAVTYDSVSGVRTLASTALPAGSASDAVRVNAHGQTLVVLYSASTGLLIQPDGTALTVLNAGPSGQILLAGLTDGGTVAGSVSFDDFTIHAFLWDALSGATDLTPDASIDSQAFGLNNLNQVVGMLHHKDTLDSGSFYYDGTVHDLEDLLDPSSRVWNDIYPIAINDAGQIAGYAVSADGGFHGLLLSPAAAGAIATPEPASAAMLLLLFAIRPRRRRGALLAGAYE